MNAIDPNFDQPIGRAVRAAAAQLVSVNVWADAAYVSTPLYHPSGASATVKVEYRASDFKVSDNGFAYREGEMLGAERFFRRAVEDQASLIGASTDKRAIYLIVTEAELAGAITEVAAASVRVSEAILKKAGARGEAEIIDHLYRRLVHVFGDYSVKAQVPIRGPSTKNWYADAIVQAGGQTAIFQAVTNHHASVYSTSAMFHDLALNDEAPTMVSVVQSRTGMGPLLGILAQAGNVIEEEQPDAVYRAAVEAFGLRL